MSKLIASSIDHNIMNYCSPNAVVYVWNENNILEVHSSKYLTERENYIWKYAYLHDPGMSTWNKAMIYFKHGHFYIYRKNKKNIRRKNSPHNSAMYEAAREEVSKEFLASLFLLGVVI